MNNSCKPLISVIIPTYNCADYLDETIKSVLSQTYNNFEIIIIDDGSSDNTKCLVDKYINRNVKYYYQENFGGPSKARNVGLKYAKGEFICFFDSDDLMEKDHLFRKINIFLNCPDIDFVFSEFSIIDEQGKVIHEKFLKNYTSFKSGLSKDACSVCPIIFGERLYIELLMANFIGTSGAVMKTQIVRDSGGFDEKFKNADDVDLWYRLARLDYVFGFDNIVSHFYRKRSGSVTGRGLNRYPNVINMLIKQKEFKNSKRSSKILDRNIQRNYFSYAWGLRKSGEYQLSKYMYIKSFKYGLTLKSVKGYLHSYILNLLKTYFQSER